MSATEVEDIKPYGNDRGDKTSQVRAMFDNIAPAYDFMNRAMTLGVDRIWRRKAVNAVCTEKPSSVLDVACGTGDMTIALARRLPEAKITGLDLSEKMLEIGRHKLQSRGLAERISLMAGDSLHMPFDDCSFDCVTVAYGVRNFADLSAGYNEIRRVLKPGGFLCVLELSTPSGKITGSLYRFYTRKLIPLAGRRISKDPRAYAYLPESIAAVAQGNDMLALMKRSGFTDTLWQPLTFGSCSIYTGRRGNY